MGTKTTGGWYVRHATHGERPTPTWYGPFNDRITCRIFGVFHYLFFADVHPGIPAELDGDAVASLDDPDIEAMSARKEARFVHWESAYIASDSVGVKRVAGDVEREIQKVARAGALMELNAELRSGMSLVEANDVIRSHLERADGIADEPFL